jgi:tetratricopeptide (TPR) repeat protein
MYTTALVMIARNEARCITNSLRRIRPWVDHMIVLDTGSTDDTAALAHAEGAQVHHFEWVHDFAAARNAALALSTADWNIVIDADECLTDGGEVLLALKRQAPDFVGRLEVYSTFEPVGAASHQASSTWIPRALPAGIAYEGSIHEQPISALPRRNLTVRLNHDGYMPAQMEAKRERNWKLLEVAIQATPDDAYLHYQIGKEHEVHGRLELASEAYDTSQSLLGTEAGKTPTWRHDLVLRSLYTLKACNRLAQAIHLAEAEMPHWSHSADFYFTLGDVLLSQALAHPEEADALLPLIESCWQQSLALGDTPDLEGAVHGRGSHLAAHNLVVFYNSLGQPDKAALYRARAIPIKTTP